MTYDPVSVVAPAGKIRFRFYSVFIKSLSEENVGNLQTPLSQNAKLETIFFSLSQSS